MSKLPPRTSRTLPSNVKVRSELPFNPQLRLALAASSIQVRGRLVRRRPTGRAPVPVIQRNPDECLAGSDGAQKFYRFHKCQKRSGRSSRRSMRCRIRPTVASLTCDSTFPIMRCSPKKPFRGGCPSRRRRSGCPPTDDGRSLASYAAVVRDYIARYRVEAAEEMAFYGRSSLDVTVLSRLKGGARHSHQYRVPQAVLEMARDRLRATIPLPTRGRDFGALLSFADSIIMTDSEDR
jgi:hypothetical protein